MCKKEIKEYIVRNKKSVIKVVTTVILLFLFAVLLCIIWGDNLEEENKPAVLTAIFAIEVLFFSVVSQIYSSLLRSAESAEGNMYSYGLQSDTITITNINEKDTYRKIVQGWYEASKKLRHGVKLRAYSANSCLVALFFLGITYGIFFWNRECICWEILLTISSAFLFFAFFIYLFEIDNCFTRRLAWWGIDPNLERWRYIKTFINEHSWLDEKSDTAETKETNNEE